MRVRVPRLAAHGTGGRVSALRQYRGPFLVEHGRETCAYNAPVSAVPFVSASGRRSQVWRGTHEIAHLGDRVTTAAYAVVVTCDRTPAVLISYPDWRRRRDEAVCDDWLCWIGIPHVEVSADAGAVGTVGCMESSRVVWPQPWPSSGSSRSRRRRSRRRTSSLRTRRVREPARQRRPDRLDHRQQLQPVRNRLGHHGHWRSQHVEHHRVLHPRCRRVSPPRRRR